MKKSPVIWILGLAAIALTTILYFTILGDTVLTTIHFIALIAMVVAEAATTAYAWFANGEPRKVAATVVSGFLIPYSVILSVVYLSKFPSNYGAYLGWYFAGAIVLNAICLIFMNFGVRKSVENAQFQDAKSNMLGLRKIVKCIMADPAAAAYDSQLRALEEKLHFSKDNVIVAEDANIRQLLLQLQEGIADPEFDAEQMMQKIAKAIDVRNIMAQ